MHIGENLLAETDDLKCFRFKTHEVIYQNH